MCACVRVEVCVRVDVCVRGRVSCRDVDVAVRNGGGGEWESRAGGAGKVAAPSISLKTSSAG